MHILIIPSWYPTNENPISGIFFKEQAKALQRNGHKVTVAYPDIRSLKKYNKNQPSRIVHKVEDGISTYRYYAYNYFIKLPFANRINYVVKLKQLYRQIIKDEGYPDIIHAHSCFWGGWAATKLDYKSNIPIVITEHATAFIRNMLSSNEEKFAREAMKKADRVISVGPRLYDVLIKYTERNKISMIHNIVDTNFFEIKNNITENTRFRFFSVSFLTYKKGMDVLIKAFAHKFKGKNYELIIGGKGDEENNLMKLSEELNISQQIRFIGELSRSEVKKQMQECDCFVLASRFETFGVVYIEALACGKPIIATASGGPEIIVNDKNGILVEVDNIEELGEAMIKIAQDITKYNNLEIRNDCINRFSEKVIIEELTTLYQNILLEVDSRIN